MPNAPTKLSFVGGASLAGRMKVFYNSPENIHMELIEGQIYYQAAPFAVNLSTNSKKNIVEPDISVICDCNKLTDRGCFGAPDWIIEIVSPGNPEHDFIYKLNLYAKSGVQEYWIVDPRTETVLVYYLEQKDFSVKTCTFQDKIKVNIYDDFVIDFQKLDL